MRRSHLLAVLGPALALGCALSPGAPATDAQLEPLGPGRLAPFAGRVEAVRGLRFLRPVEAWRASPETVPALLARELDRAAPRKQIARETELGVSLGLLPPRFDLRAAVLAFETENAAGFYSPLDDRLYVVDGAASAGAESADALLVHELAHALQAQHSAVFETLLGIEGHDDLMFALSALLEGEATFVELADAEAQTGQKRPAPAAFAARFRAAQLAPELPRAVAESFVAPYPLGYALSDALAARGGTGALDAAHADPPLASEQLLHPERYLDAAQREPLAELPRDPHLRGCRVVTSNCYGELGVRVWLEELGAEAGQAASAADGWDADRAWRLDCGKRAASAWLLELDDGAEARELAALLHALAPEAGGVALSLAVDGARLLVSNGLRAGERAQLLALEAPQRFARLADYLAAHPEVQMRARRLRR